LYKLGLAESSKVTQDKHCDGDRKETSNVSDLLESKLGIISCWRDSFSIVSGRSGRNKALAGLLDT
jgi:hypothetical protein